MAFVSNTPRVVNEADMDTVVNNARIRATTTAQTVRSVTFPANPQGTNYFEGVGTPVSISTSTTQAIDTGQLLTGLIVIKPTAANVAVTFDTAAQMVAGCNAISSVGVQVGDYIPVLLINGASATNTLTPTAGNGVTFDSNQATTTIAAATSRYILFRFTNVTPGSEAVVMYW